MKKHQDEHNAIKKSAVWSLITMLIGLLILLFLELLGTERILKGYVTLLAFWPLYVFSLFQAIRVSTFYLRNRNSIRVNFLLMALPALLFLLYFFYRIVSQ